MHKFNKQLTLQSVEEKYSRSIIIKGLPDKKQVLLKGFIDRIDRVGQFIRIIDYKTGNVQQRDLVLKDWDDLITNPKLDKCFQLLFYSYLYPDDSGVNAEVKSGIFSFRNMNSGFLSAQYPNDKENSNSEFEAVLNQLFTEIYNPEIAFKQTEELANCEYCPYVSICSR